MNKIHHSILVLLAVSFMGIFGQEAQEAAKSDLIFHSEFEKVSFNKFLEGGDVFPLYLAIDEKINKEVAASIYEIYLSVFVELEESDVVSKKINKKIKLTSEIIQSHFIKLYSDSDYFASLILDGKYNFLTKCMVYSLIFDQMEIPYKVMASATDVYLVANPGPSSIVIETANPNAEIHSFTPDEKKQKIKVLKNSSDINEEELVNKSFEEIFAAQFDEVTELSPTALPGIQYYFKAKVLFDASNYKEANEELKKAHVFFPDKQVDYLMSSSLQILLENSTFEDPKDMDMLSQFAGINGTDKQIVLEIFQNILKDQLKKDDNHEHCDVLYESLVTGIEDSGLIEEISFKYNYLMSLHYKDSFEAEKYFKGAMELRNSYQELEETMKVHFYNYFREIYKQPKKLYSEVTRVRTDMNYECIQDELDYFEMLALLQLAESSLKSEKSAEAEGYLDKYESLYKTKHFDELMQEMLISSYRSLAVKLYYDGKKTKAKEIVDRGLKYVPDNSFLKSVVY
ncbi:MAG: hypothetical protein PF450_14410 [Bacteroidales bacterium]|jgi:tetratricopeptide (TPR) repeat protein|nr:hypothetical protein [Bacteroidales bacterium]